MFKNMSKLKVCLSFAMILLLQSCGQKESFKKNTPESSPEVKSEREIKKSFSISSEDSVTPSPSSESKKTDENISANTKMMAVSTADKYKVEIKKSALEKEFLLQASMIMQPQIALSNGLRSRIVSFRDRGSDLILLESTQGHTISKETPQNLVIAVFPVLKRTTTENDEVIQFDFNKGMSDLYVASDWNASDFDGTNYSPDQNFSLISAKQSYLEDVEFVNNHLVIRQVSQLHLHHDSNTEISIPTEIKYYLSPYSPNVNFKSFIKKQDFERMGFFEIAPTQLENGPSQIKISKFDINKPIVFALSSNTPEKFKQAVIDGVLYWNKAFEKEVIKVVDAPVGVHAPDLNYNVIQWINWDEAGFAYADGQMDPRTGETLHAQVYFTSAFAVGGKIQARRLIKTLTDNQSVKKYKIGLKGFSNFTMCSYSMTESFVSSLTNLLVTNADDGKILKAAQDYIREVSAHEIGHTLGLRHNFAGSLATSYGLEERPDHIKNYFANGSTDPNITTSSSVMEYQVFEESIMTGDQIAKSQQALSYDDKAIKTLYLDKTYKDDEIPLFCTDSQLAKSLFADCKAFDFGSSPLTSLLFYEKNSKKNFINAMVNRYVFAKAPLEGYEEVPVEKVDLVKTQDAALSLLFNRFRALMLLNGKTQLLAVHRQLPKVDGENMDEITKLTLDKIIQEYEKINGFKLFLSDIETQYQDELKEELESQLEKNSSGIGFNEKPYEFTASEMIFIKNKLNRYIEQIFVELQNSNLQLLSGKPVFEKITGLKDSISYGEHEKLNGLVTFYTDLVKKYLTSEKGESFKVEIEVPTDKKDSSGAVIKNRVQAPVFKYPYITRKYAAEMINPNLSQNPFWSQIAKAKNKDYFLKYNKAFLNHNLNELKAEEMPTMESAQWILENQSILNTL